MKNSETTKLKFNFDKSAMRLLYYKNKDYVVPVLVIFVSILIFLFVVVAQIQNFLLIQTEVSQARQRIAQLQNNLSVIKELDDNALNKDLGLSLTALPFEKNYSGILNVVTAASQKANVIMNDFSFEVGELSSSSAQVNSFPLSINLVLNISGGVSQTQRLVHELAKTMPISEVIDINIQNNLSALTTNFYYKPFSPIRVDYLTPIVPFSEKEKKAFQVLSSF